MGYLLTEIVVYLVIAGLIGFVFGWAAKAGSLDKYSSKVKELLKSYYLTLTTTKKVVKEAKESVKESVPEKVAEALKEEVLEETVAETTKESVKKVTEVIQEEVIEKTTTEITKENVKEEIYIEFEEDVSKPTLLTEAPSEEDKLSTLKGLGPVMEKKLNALGIYTFEQMASWNSEQELWIGSQLSSPNKVIKEEWVKQAKELLKNK